MERMAKLLDVSTSGYYGWFSRPESVCASRNDFFWMSW